MASVYLPGPSVLAASEGVTFRQLAVAGRVAALSRQAGSDHRRHSPRFPLSAAALPASSGCSAEQHWALQGLGSRPVLNNFQDKDRWLPALSLAGRPSARGDPTLGWGLQARTLEQIPGEQNPRDSRHRKGLHRSAMAT